MIGSQKFGEMAGIAMASMVQTEFWNQVSDRLLAPVAGKTEPVAVALPGSLPELAVENVPMPVPVPTQVPAAEEKKPDEHRYGWFGSGWNCPVG